MADDDKKTIRAGRRRGSDHRAANGSAPLLPNASVKAINPDRQEPDTRGSRVHQAVPRIPPSVFQSATG